MQKSIKYLVSSGLLAGLLLQTACSTEKTNSENVRTAGIWARMVADAGVSGTRVVVELNSGGTNGTNIVLSAGDRLEVTAGGITKVMQQDSDFLDVDYEASFSGNLGGEEFVVNFIRPNDTDAPDSSVVLPREFTIFTPVRGQSYSSNDAVLVTWTNNSGASSLDFDYSITCRTSANTTTSAIGSPTVVDDGDHIIQLSNQAIFSDISVLKSEPCTLNIHLERESRGILDPNFTEGGSIKAFQPRRVRDVTINIQ